MPKLPKFPVALEYCLNRREFVIQPHLVMRWFGILCIPNDRSLKKILDLEAPQCHGTYFKAQYFACNKTTNLLMQLKIFMWLQQTACFWARLRRSIFTSASAEDHSTMFLWAACFNCFIYLLSCCYFCLRWRTTLLMKFRVVFGPVSLIHQYDMMLLNTWWACSVLLSPFVPFRIIYLKSCSEIATCLGKASVA